MDTEAGQTFLDAALAEGAHLTQDGHEYYLSEEYTCQATDRSFRDQVSVNIAADGAITATNDAGTQ